MRGLQLRGIVTVLTLASIVCLAEECLPISLSLPAKRKVEIGVRHPDFGAGHYYTRILPRIFECGSGGCCRLNEDLLIKSFVFTGARRALDVPDWLHVGEAMLQ